MPNVETLQKDVGGESTLPVSLSFYDLRTLVLPLGLPAEVFLYPSGSEFPFTL